MKDPKLTVRVSQDMYKRFRLKCFKNSQTVQEVLKQTIVDYLASTLGKAHSRPAD
jgi:hypothetical protein